MWRQSRLRGAVLAGADLRGPTCAAPTWGRSAWRRRRRCAAPRSPRSRPACCCPRWASPSPRRNRTEPSTSGAADLLGKPCGREARCAE
ncbi:hypothetical protein ACFQXA_03895 [Nocardiopsis composta]